MLCGEQQLLILNRSQELCRGSRRDRPRAAVETCARRSPSEFSLQPQADRAWPAAQVDEVAWFGGAALTARSMAPANFAANSAMSRSETQAVEHRPGVPGVGVDRARCRCHTPETAFDQHRPIASAERRSAVIFIANFIEAGIS